MWAWRRAMLGLEPSGQAVQCCACHATLAVFDAVTIEPPLRPARPSTQPVPAAARPRPQPVITTPGNAALSAATQLSFSISFGEPVLGADPFKLFGHSGELNKELLHHQSNAVASGSVDACCCLVLLLLLPGAAASAGPPVSQRGGEGIHRRPTAAAAALAGPPVLQARSASTLCLMWRQAGWMW